MARPRLIDLLGPPLETGDALRWQAAVPIGTNIFMLVELLQFAFVGAAVVVLTLCAGVWYTEGGMTMQEATAALSVACMTLAAVMIGFVLMAFIFFGNRYFAVYRLDSSGIYYEGSRGQDERHTRLCLRFSPFPVVGDVTAGRTRSKHLTWGKIDSFQSIESMRAIMLRRGRWHIVRLYTPDNATHAQVVTFLAGRLRKIDG